MGLLVGIVSLLWRVITTLLILAIGLAVVGLAVIGTADGLVALTARNTVMHQLAPLLPAWLAPADPATQPTGSLTGAVSGRDGRPVGGATVLVADRRGVAYRATTDATGRYRLDGVPAGDYRPVVAAAGHGPVADPVALPTPSSQLGTLRWRPAVTVRGGQVATADLRLDAPRRVTPTAGARVELGAETLVEQGEPYPGRARRQPFTLVAPRRDPIILDGLAATIKPAPPERSATGVLYAPTAGGPYPTVFIIYPGLPETWEAISVAMASGGFTVIAFTPLNFPDMIADTADLLFLTDELTAGRLTRHAATGRQCAAGGSFSTLWTFLLVQQTDAYRCVLSLGGLSDAFLYRADWTAGRVTPDPRMAPVPEMMAAMGPPDAGPDLYLRLSVIEHLDRLPPTLIVHGSGDTLVQTNQSERLAERLRARGQPHELQLYGGMEHYLDASKPDPNNADLLARTLAFFHQHLG